MTTSPSSSHDDNHGDDDGNIRINPKSLEALRMLVTIFPSLSRNSLTMTMGTSPYLFNGVIDDHNLDDTKISYWMDPHVTDAKFQIEHENDSEDNNIIHKNKDKMYTINQLSLGGQRIRFNTKCLNSNNTNDVERNKREIYVCNTFQRACAILGQSLRVLNLGGTDIPIPTLCDSILSVPSFQTNLMRLHFGGNGLGDAGMSLLASNIGKGKFKNLRTLDLRYNDIGHMGCLVLVNDVLLGIDSQRLGENGCSAENETTISPPTFSHASTTPIQKLYLEGNAIGDEGANYLGKALKDSNISLTDLYLGANGIGPDGAVGLATGVRFNRTLRQLYLEGNHIGPSGANAFSNVLEELNTLGIDNEEENEQQQQQRVLETLYVDNNGIGKDSTKRLCAALQSSSAITDGF